MTLLAQDTFIRANQAGFGTASDGSVWAEAGTPTGQQSILSNEGLYSAVNGNGYSLLGSGTTGQVNNLVEVRTATTNDYGGPIIRFDSTNINGYVATVGDGILYLEIITADIYTHLATVALTGWVQGDKWWVRLTGDGTTLSATAWKDGTAEPSPMLTATDTTYTSGKYGCHCSRQGTSVTTSYIEVTDTPSVGSGPGQDPVIYGSAVLDTTLTTASAMTTNIGGTEISKVTTSPTGNGNFIEVTSQGLAGTAAAAISATPTGHGWVYKPGAGTFAAGTWSALCTMANTTNSGSWRLRFFRLPGGTLASAVSIGLITANISAMAKTTYTFAPTALPQSIFGATDLLYIDLWYEDNSGASGDTVTVYESTTATAGVPNDMQITTASFTPLAVASFVKPYVHYSIPRAFGGTIIPQVIMPPLIYQPRAFGGTILTDSRTFVPRAFGGTYISDDPAQLWVPRALGGTTQIPVSTGVSLSSTIPGVGTLAGTFSLATVLADTIAGVGTLTGTMVATTPLAAIIPGVGTLAGTFSLATNLTSTIPGVGTLTPTLSANTALATTIPGVGTLAGTLSANTSLSVTIPGIGTLSATLQEATALATTIPGVGTLSGTFSLATALTSTIPGIGTLTGTLSTTGGVSLAVTMAGVGTITGTMTLATALTVTEVGVGTLTPTLSANLALPSTTLIGAGTLAATLSAGVPLAVSLHGVGTLSGVFTLRVALSLTFAGLGTIAGAITIPSLSFLTATWVTRDMAATWVTRDSKVTWTTRDEKAAWNARDEQTIWDSRDELALWKTRS